MVRRNTNGTAGFAKARVWLVGEILKKANEKVILKTEKEKIENGSSRMIRTNGAADAVAIGGVARVAQVFRFTEPKFAGESWLKLHKVA